MGRLTVYIDYQNVYRGARRAFLTETAPAPHGQIHPDAVGVLLQARRDQQYRGTAYATELKQIRVYRGMPDGAMDAKGHSAASRQIMHWERHDDVRVYTHPIKYPRGWENEWDRARIRRSGEKPREKGIDVQLAVDLVLGAVRDKYDNAIVFSGDLDLLPAIRAALKLGKHIEVAAWCPKDRPMNRIPASDIPPYEDGRPRGLWCHQLVAEDFAFARDNTDYTRP